MCRTFKSRKNIFKSHCSKLSFFTNAGISYIVQKFSIIHPDLLHCPIQLCGPSLMRESQKWTRGKISIRGKTLPEAPIVYTAETNLPLSPDVIEPTLHVPFAVKTCFEF